MLKQLEEENTKFIMIHAVVNLYVILVPGDFNGYGYFCARPY